jgi:hypothetical protein
MVFDGRRMEPRHFRETRRPVQPPCLRFDNHRLSKLQAIWVCNCLFGPLALLHRPQLVVLPGFSTPEREIHTVFRTRFTHQRTLGCVDITTTATA